MKLVVTVNKFRCSTSSSGLKLDSIKVRFLKLYDTTLIQSNLSPDDDVEQINLLTVTTSFIYLQSSQGENK